MNIVSSAVNRERPFRAPGCGSEKGGGFDSAAPSLKYDLEI